MEKITETAFEWCMVGNIVQKQLYGPEKELHKGSKHFSAGTKVYCFPQYGGMGHESMPVIGLHRQSRRAISIVITSKLIENMRVKRVYKTFVIEKIRQSYYYKHWKETENGLEQLKEFAQSFNVL